MTKKQEDLLNSFLAGLGVEDEPVYREIAMYLSGLGYEPRRVRSYIAFVHKSRGQQIAKMGYAWTKDHAPYFALKFSACEGYSRRFADAVGDYIAKNPTNLFPHCEDERCIYREDGERAPFYEIVTLEGETQACCGLKKITIPHLAAGDVEELKRIIREEHAYLIGNEAEAADEA